MPVTPVADLDALNVIIQNWLVVASGLNDQQVIYQDQPYPFAKGDGLRFKFIDVSLRSWSNDRIYKNTGLIETKKVRRVQIEIKSYADSGFKAMKLLRNVFESMLSEVTRLNVFRINCISLINQDTVRDTSFVEDNEVQGRAELKPIFEVEFTPIEEDLENIGYFDQTNANGEILAPLGDSEYKPIVQICLNEIKN